MTGREETKRRQRQTHGWLALAGRTVIHHSKRYHTFAFLMLMCCLFAVMSTCNWILIHYTFNEPLVSEVRGGEVPGEWARGCSFRWWLQFLTTGVPKVSLVCVEVYFVKANTTPLWKKQGFLFRICACGPRTSIVSSDWKDKWSDKPLPSPPPGSSDISGPKNSGHYGFGLF